MNLFAYCKNNSICYSDENGNWLSLATKVCIGLAVIEVCLIASIVCIATGAAAACLTTSMAVVTIQGALLGAVSGAITGAIVAQLPKKLKLELGKALGKAQFKEEIMLNMECMENKRKIKMQLLLIKNK